MGQQIRLSVPIITYNEAANIGRCIDSVLPVADEIVVVDSLSTDRTLDICATKGVRIFEQPFLGYVEQKNFAIEQASCNHVLSLDADECLSPRLAELVATVKANWSADGFTVNRCNNYYGKWMRYGGLYPDRKLRLWDRRKGRWGGFNPHDHVLMAEGAVVTDLGADLLHYAYRSIEDHANQANRFSTIAARAYFDAGRSGTLLNVLANPAVRFLRDYFARFGFLDGFHGFMVCKIDAHMTFLKYAKLSKLHKLSDRNR